MERFWNSKKRSEIILEYADILKRTSQIPINPNFQINSVPICGKDLFLVFTRIRVNFVLIAAALRLCLDTAAKASPMQYFTV